MSFLERVFSNYFLAWSQIFNYTDKTSRIAFWHFIILDSLVGTLATIYSTIFANDLNNFYTINQGYDWGILYSISSFFVFIALLTRRLRDIGKENLILWVFCSFIPFYNLYLFAQPSSEEQND